MITPMPLLIINKSCLENQVSQCITFQLLLQVHDVSDCYKALAQLVEMLRRAGQLDDAIPLLTAAEKSSSRVSYDPGYNYCQGLYHW